MVLSTPTTPPHDADDELPEEFLDDFRLPRHKVLRAAVGGALLCLIIGTGFIGFGTTLKPRSCCMPTGLCPAGAATRVSSMTQRDFNADIYASVDARTGLCLFKDTGGGQNALGCSPNLTDSALTFWNPQCAPSRDVLCTAFGRGGGGTPNPSPQHLVATSAALLIFSGLVFAAFAVLLVRRYPAGTPWFSALGALLMLATLAALVLAGVSTSTATTKVTRQLFATKIRGDEEPVVLQPVQGGPADACQGAHVGVVNASTTMIAALGSELVHIDFMEGPSGLALDDGVLAIGGLAVVTAAVAFAAFLYVSIGTLSVAKIQKYRRAKGLTSTLRRKNE